MIVSLTLGHILLLLLPAAISAFLFRLCFIKWKWHEKLFGLAFIPGIILYLVSWSVFTSDLVLVNDNLEVERLMVLFSANYESPDKQKMHISQVKNNDVFIVNASDVALSIEQISYGEPSFLFDFFGPTVIPPHRTMLDHNVPDYFPNERPPQSVSVQRGIKHDSKNWLREASEEEVSNASENSDLVNQ